MNHATFSPNSPEALGVPCRFYSWTADSRLICRK